MLFHAARWRRALGIAALSLTATPIFATEADPAQLPKPLLLWSEGAPGAKGSEEADQPWLWAFPAPADKATGAAMVVCPGGGYAHLATGHEGLDVARWLNDLGISAYVLKYRLSPKYNHPAPLDDVQRAIRTVRANAASWKLDPQRVGVLGFSAGGHLATSAATHFDAGKPDAADPIDHVSCRPDVLVACYPVVSFSSEFTHTGSRKNLLGATPDPELVNLMSNEKQVTAETPPTFLFHTGEDTGVPPENSLAFYVACRKAKVPVELHIFEPGKHGLGLAPDVPGVKAWPAQCAAWLQLHGFIPAKYKARPSE